MLIANAAVVFSASGRIETYVVPVSGGYIIEASGAGEGSLRGDRIKGMFYLRRGDILKILVGCREAEAGASERAGEINPGGSIVWRGAADLLLPAQLMLAASGGASGRTGLMTGGAGASVAGSFNSGAFQVNVPGVHGGDGCVSIVPVTAPVACGSKEELAKFAQASAGRSQTQPAGMAVRSGV
jgi:hypothetical protein